MRVYIKTSEGRNLRFPLPMGLVRFGIGLGSMVTRISRRHLDEETRRYLDALDWGMLSRSFGELRYYKGLKLVDIKSSTGEEVTIIV